MKILHAADLHLDTPFTGRSEAQVQFLRRQLLQVPEKLARLCRQEGCDLVLLAGDMFDGAWTQDSVDALRSAIADMAVPVFISPGNHDFCGLDSPYLLQSWPENAHIFTQPVMQSTPLPELDCRIYGAGYQSMDCPALLKGFHATGEERWKIGILHGDPTQTGSPYCPINSSQLRGSGLDYLALGHIHQSGSVRAGGTVCAWPGCPMGRGFDETGDKGVLLVTLDEGVNIRPISLDVPKFYDLEAPVTVDPEQAVSRLLPLVANSDFYRITLTGESEKPDLSALSARFSQFPNLELRDRTVPISDIWSELDSDTLEGEYFRLLKDAMDAADEEKKQAYALAAKLSRQILDGREVSLP